MALRLEVSVGNCVGLEMPWALEMPVRPSASWGLMVQWERHRRQQMLMMLQGTQSLGIPRDSPARLTLLEGFLGTGTFHVRSRRKKKPQLVTEGKSVIEHSRARRESGANTWEHENTCSGRRAVWVELDL